MSERMRKIIELGEDLRQNDIELGRRLERERIIELLEGITPGSGIMGYDIGLAIELINGEN